MLVETIKPEPDKQFRLLPCVCGGEPHYIKYRGKMLTKWKVVCTACGLRTKSFLIRHDAQLDWNTAIKGVKR